MFFFQPFFRLAVRSVLLAAEEECDDWAARQSEDRLAMASCLAEVAAWVLPQDRRLPVPGMARRRSQLRVRVDRLMDEQRREAPSRIWRGLGFGGLIALALWLAPAVAPASERAHEEQGGVESELLLTIEARAAQLESELQLLTEALGPLADTPRYHEQLERIRAQRNQLRPTRGLLRSVFGAPSERKEEH